MPDDTLPPPAVIGLGAWKFELHPAYDTQPGLAVTVIPEGFMVTAVPEDSDTYRATAARLGYAGTWDMCQRHDLTHGLLGWLLGVNSPALLSVPAMTGPSVETGLEEDAVMAIERYANARGVDLRRRAADLAYFGPAQPAEHRPDGQSGCYGCGGTGMVALEWSTRICARCHGTGIIDPLTGFRATAQGAAPTPPGGDE